MMPSLISRCFVYLFLLAGVCLLLVGCNMDSNENGLVASSPKALNTTQPTATITFTPTIETQLTFTPDSESQKPEEITSATATIVPMVTATSTPTPTLTPTPVPLPTPVFIECQTTSPLPDKAFPTQIDMTGSHNQRVAVSYPYMYLAAEHYIGIFDISSPDKPIFLGFWEFPDWPNISTLQVNSGIIYFTSGSTLVILNLSPNCLFETITTIDVPLQVFQLEIEESHLYIGGFSEDEEMQVLIYLIEGLGIPQQVGNVDLGSVPSLWSVFEDTLYSLGDKLTVTNVFDPTMPQTQDVNIVLDPQVLNFSPAEFFEGGLYLLWEGRYLTIISDLQNETPVVKRDSQQRIIGGDLSNFVYQISENYIFLGDSLCGISCRSVVTFFDSEDGRELSAYGLPDDHYPIHSYYEISPDIIYAFSDEFLLAIDISDIANPKIVAEVPLIT